MRKLKNKELNRLNLSEFKRKKKVPITIVLDNVRSAHNVGSVFRTSDAFLIEQIILCGICPIPPKKEIQKTALGSTESVNWVYSPKTMDCIKELINQNYEIISLEQTNQSISLKDYRPQKNSKIALIFGNEVNGVNQECLEFSHSIVEIPQYGTKHSLNISVSVGIVLWEITNKLTI